MSPEVHNLSDAALELLRDMQAHALGSSHPDHPTKKASNFRRACERLGFGENAKWKLMDELYVGGHAINIDHAYALIETE